MIEGANLPVILSVQTPVAPSGLRAGQIFQTVVRSDASGELFAQFSGLRVPLDNAAYAAGDKIQAEVLNAGTPLQLRLTPAEASQPTAPTAPDPKLSAALGQVLQTLETAIAPDDAALLLPESLPKTAAPMAQLLRVFTADGTLGEDMAYLAQTVAQAVVDGAASESDLQPFLAFIALTETPEESASPANVPTANASSVNLPASAAATAQQLPATDAAQEAASPAPLSVKVSLPVPANTAATNTMGESATPAASVPNPIAAILANAFPASAAETTIPQPAAPPLPTATYEALARQLLALPEGTANAATFAAAGLLPEGGATVPETVPNDLRALLMLARQPAAAASKAEENPLATLPAALALTGDDLSPELARLLAAPQPAATLSELAPQASFSSGQVPPQTAARLAEILRVPDPVQRLSLLLELVAPPQTSDLPETATPTLTARPDAAATPSQTPSLPKEAPLANWIRTAIATPHETTQTLPPPELSSTPAPQQAANTPADPLAARLQTLARNASADAAAPTRAARLVAQGRIEEAVQQMEASLRATVSRLRGNEAFLAYVRGKGQINRFQRTAERALDRLGGESLQNLRAVEQPYQFIELPLPPGKDWQRAQIHYFPEGRGGQKGNAKENGTVVLDVATRRLGALWISLRAVAGTCSCNIRATTPAVADAFRAQSDELEANLASAGYAKTQVQVSLWDGNRTRAAASLMQRFTGFNANG